ncbi:MAG: phage holin family protein [Schleiferiaceae bacterium]|nr:phage holin family protein [Schleiferiaceae bacterium]
MNETTATIQVGRPGWGTRFVIRTLSVFTTAYLLPGVELAEFTTAIWASLALAFLNVTVRPLLILFTIPLTLFTLGLFLLAINAILVLLASEWVDGFAVQGFWAALLFSMVMTLVSSILEGNIRAKHVRV